MSHIERSQFECQHPRAPSTLAGFDRAFKKPSGSQSWRRLNQIKWPAENRLPSSVETSKCERGLKGFPQEQGPFFVGGPFDVREGLQAEPAGARAEGGLQEEPGPHAGARLRLQEGLGGLPGNFPEAQVELLIHRPGSQIWTRYPQR
ncbi:hypothetical protein AVEN_118917-2 [Araneus ventricosus]|uniref:Uncharacterized protein n=1 Tax=Araneus ventricosus TaxID=182803 RepID=A0A4Y2BX75_ARAVE|nr:hypothetical protein AVEN_118917-2 [Araneus ventricosus]